MSIILELWLIAAALAIGFVLSLVLAVLIWQRKDIQPVLPFVAIMASVFLGAYVSIVVKAYNHHPPPAIPAFSESLTDSGT